MTEQERTITDLERQTRKRIADHAFLQYGIKITSEEWGFDADDEVIAKLGRWVVLEENEDCGLYGGDEGELHACVVGAEEYHNVAVKYYFTPDAHSPDSGGEAVTPFDDIEPL